ncbi:unnamed protein product [Phyllotreta striolata]|uniref:Sodium/nucleoside cotransporter n=1 Tax=Phyllotreta striolata TaxID=444603 RepID=A0A9N9TB61_PHYSR|nr:unnamed protein product [Phyllotreta striolata]
MIGEDNEATVQVSEVSVTEKEDTNDKKRFVLNKTLRNGLILSVITAYFAWATYHYVDKYGGSWINFNATTCNGYGFLVILYGFILFGFIKVYVLNPLVFPILTKSFEDFKWKFNQSADKKPLLKGIIRHRNKIIYGVFFTAVAIYLIIDTSDNRNRLIPLSGLFVFLIIGFIFSNSKSNICWDTVIWGIILQFLFGLLTIRWDVGRNILDCVGNKVNTLLDYGFTASEFPYGEELVQKEKVFAFRSLSTVFFINFLANILYYYGIMQKVVTSVGSFMQWVMGTSICESVSSAATIFFGMSEGPILLAPYLEHLTNSEIHSVMTSGFAMVSGSVMAGYISYGARAQDLITASIMSAPAALCYSKLMHPETEKVVLQKENIETVEIEFESALDAASKGATNAIGMVQGIIAGLIAFLAAVYMINDILGWIGMLIGYSDPMWTLELITGKIFIPISFIMGVPWDECESVATLIGIKTMVNEFVAFKKMGEMLEQGLLGARTKVIATYAICGFSNPGSIGIMMSLLAALIPSKRDVVAKLVFSSWFAGALVCFMTACIAGTLMPDDIL